MEDSFKIAGPLKPQWVINNGPDWLKSDCESLLSFNCDLSNNNFTLAFGTLNPISSAIKSFSILKVNNDGTGSIIL